MKTKSKVIFFFIIVSGFFLLQQCKNKDDVIPYVYVDYYIYLSDPDFSALNAVGNYVYVTGGYRGMIIYRKSIDEFAVYDRACTFQPSKECEKVEIDENQLVAVCSCCNSKFTLYDGYVMEGPASMPLKQYNASFDGNTLVHIYN
jgi:nitrite reductase/ring-hydroxylating ferredoxin subunit